MCILDPKSALLELQTQTLNLPPSSRLKGDPRSAGAGLKPPRVTSLTSRDEGQFPPACPICASARAWPSPTVAV